MNQHNRPAGSPKKAGLRYHIYVMIKLGIILLTATVAVLVAEFFRGRSRTSSMPPENHSTENRSTKENGNAGKIIAAIVLVLSGALLLPASARAAGLTLPPAAKQGLDLLYAGQPEKAIVEFQLIQTTQPESPLGYLLEAEARWWQIYCEACEIKWNLIDAWERPPRPSDDAYLALTDKGTRLAEAQIARGDSAEMEFYAGMGWLLRARLLGLRDERRGTARAGVRGRAYMLRCLELDPQMADAYAGLGLYNYYVDTLSAMAKILRFFMGIPGGKKQDGVRQLRIAMQQGVVTRVGARFYLAKNMRNYEGNYTGAIEVMTPLIVEYPQNPIFRLVLGDTQAKLNRREQATASFRVAEQMLIPDAACADRVRELAAQAIAALATSPRRTGTVREYPKATARWAAGISMFLFTRALAATKPSRPAG